MRSFFKCSPTVRGEFEVNDVAWATMPVPNDAHGHASDEKSRRRTGIRRLAVASAAVGMITGTGLLTAGFAMAANTLESGNLTLTPNSGPVSTQTTWATTDACPTGFQGSAVVSEFNTDGSFASNISPVVDSPAAAFSGTLQGSISTELSATNVTNGGTVALAVGCFSQSGGTGNVEYVQLTFVQLSSDGTTYSTTNVGPTPTATLSQPATSTPSVLNNAAADPAVAVTTSPTATPTATATATASPTATATASASPTSTLPSGGAQTGYGGAALPGGPSNLLIALGAIALAGSAAAMGLAVRRSRKPTEENGNGDGTPGAN
jgi:hypothetical protein